MKVIVIVLVILIMLGGIVYTQKTKIKSMFAPNPTSTVISPSQNTTPTMSTPSQPQQSIKEIKVSGSEFSFSPATITVKRGDSVKITFMNNGAYPHNFALSGFNISTKTIQAGQSDSLTFIADKKGSFIYTCTVDSHADKGMKGTFIVE